MDVRRLGLSDEDLEALGYKVPRREGAAPDGSGSPSAPSPDRTRPPFGPWLWTVAALVGVAWVALPTQRMPRPVPANQPDSVFSSGRAMSQLVEIARAPRPVGSPEHARARSYLVDRLEALDLDVRVQEATGVAADPQGAVAAVLRNIVARRPGSSSTGTVLLTAHYDGPPLSLGAGDDGIGLAAVLETVRALTALDPLRNDLVVLLSDGKELGSLGARAFVDHHPWASDVRAVVSVDARGVSGPAFLMDGPSSDATVGEAASSLSSPAAYSALRAMPGDALGDTELRTLAGDGIAGVGLVVLGGSAIHGSPLDRPINVSEATLQHAGVQLLELARRLGGADLGRVTDRSGPPGEYVTIPWLGLVPYPGSWRLPVTVGLVLGLLLLFALVRVRGGGPPGVLAGIALGAVVVAVSAGLGWALEAMLPTLHPEVGHLEDAAYQEGLMEAALLSAVLTVLMAGYFVARRRYARGDLLVGAMVPPVLAVLGLTFTVPEALALVQGPVLVALLAALLVLMLPGRMMRRGGRFVALAVAGLVLLLAVPGVSLVTTSLTLLDAPWIAVWMALACLLLLPVAEWLLHPSPWAAPAATGLVAVVAFALSVPGVRGDAEHPAPTSLALLVDDTLTLGSPAELAVEALDITELPSPPLPDRDTSAVDGAPAQDPTGRWMQGRWLTVPGSGDSWVLSWVVDRTGAGASPGPLLLPASERWVLAGSGPETFLPAPSLQAFDVGSVEGGRRIRLIFRPGLDAEMVGLRLAEPVRGSFTSADGVPLEPLSSDPISTIYLWGKPESGAWSIDLRLVGDGSPLVFDVIEHHLRPRAILGDRFFQRADSVVADASTGSDRILQRVRFRLPIS